MKPETVAVAVDKDKGSQAALKWAVDNLLTKGKCATLIHVRQRASPAPNPGKAAVDNHAKEIFLPFRCFCTRKDIQVTDVALEDSDVARAISEYVKSNMIETLVVGSSAKTGFVRGIKSADVSGTITKIAPDFCTVFVVAKGKMASTRPATSPFAKDGAREATAEPPSDGSLRGAHLSPYGARSITEDTDTIRSPFTRGRSSIRALGELPMPESDLSFVSSSRPCSDRTSRAQDQGMMMMLPRTLSNFEMENRYGFGSSYVNQNMLESKDNFGVFSTNSYEGEAFSLSGSQSMEEVEAEMRRLKQELKQTMDMYSSACKEALSAKQKALELHRWKIEEEQRFEEARLAEEAALAIAEKEKAKCRAALEKAEAAQRIAELEAQKRIDAERKALKEVEERKMMMEKFSDVGVRYRKYTIEEIEAATQNFSASLKIGEGGYGPVFKCHLDHTPVAVKVLRPDAAQGRSQFQQEVEVLSCIRHPNMVLLLGACPEYGCLVYEHMANGSLDDRLFRRGNTPVLSWQIRFKIAAEIAAGLLFLHQTKPEPLVHRDLKPGNILLDSNFVSKISDVGLSRLVPPSVADSVTQYHMTAAAGTFCYIDPEYQQTGMLGIKSDVYSLGVMLLQIITAKPPMGLTHYVERAIDRGTFSEMLDPAVHDWPVEEALSFAKMALKCTELRKKDRPDLGTVVLPELNRLRTLGEQSMNMFSASTIP